MRLSEWREWLSQCRAGQWDSDWRSGSGSGHNNANDRERIQDIRPIAVSASIRGAVLHCVVLFLSPFAPSLVSFVSVGYELLPVNNATQPTNEQTNKGQHESNRNTLIVKSVSYFIRCVCACVPFPYPGVCVCLDRLAAVHWHSPKQHTAGCTPNNKQLESVRNETGMACGVRVA